MLAPSRLLSPAFFNRDPRRVARALLGKVLVRKTSRGILAGRIVETEAYLGRGDAAAHSASGRTARNSVVFGPPGHAYVYFIYGNHYCLNVSCLPEGEAGGVLFRALEPVAGIGEMAQAREIEIARAEALSPVVRSGRKSALATGERKSASATAQPSELYKISFLQKISSGPGRLCEALGVTRARDNGKSFVASRSDLQIVDDGYRVRRVAIGPRIGITKSAEEPLRFLIADSAFVSARLPRAVTA